MKKTNTFDIKLLPHTGYLFLILCGVFLISSCNKVVDYEKPPTENKLVIESYITEGDTAVYVRITKTGSPYKHINIYENEYYVTRAVVKFSFDNEVPQILSLSNKRHIYIPIMEIPLFAPIYSKKIKVPFANKCTLDVEYKGQKVYAEADYPSKTKINNASVILQNTKNPMYIDVEININADFPTGEINYYRIQANYEYIFNDGVSNKNYLGRLSDFLYFTSDGKNKSQKIKFNFYGNLNLTNKNKAVIYMDHLSPLFYRFRNSLKEQSENIKDEFNSEIVQIPTNIEGGLGIFTVITRDSIWADISIK